MTIHDLKGRELGATRYGHPYGKSYQLHQVLPAISVHLVVIQGLQLRLDSLVEPLDKSIGLRVPGRTSNL